MKNKVSNECYMQEVCTYFDIYAIFKQNSRETLMFVYAYLSIKASGRGVL